MLAASAYPTRRMSPTTSNGTPSLPLSPADESRSPTTQLDRGVQLKRSSRVIGRSVDLSELRSHAIDIRAAVDSLRETQIAAIMALSMLTFQSKVLFNEQSPPFLAQFYHFISKVIGPSSGLDTTLSATQSA